MTVDEAIKCQRVKLPGWYDPPLGEIVREPEIVRMAIGTTGSGVRSATAKVEWAYVPWSTNGDLRRASHNFDVKDLEPA